jgi:hypothetical protein
LVGDPGLNSHRVEAGDRVGNVRDDLVSMDDADVPVRDEGKSPPTLARTMVQHDRACCRDAAGGDYRVHLVKGCWRQRRARVVAHDVSPVAGEEHVHQQIEFAPELVVRASTNVKPRAG